MADTLNISDVHVIANAVYDAAVGNAPGTTLNTDGFVHLTSLVQKQGYDPILGALTQVLGRTLMTFRPYSAKFKSLYRNTQEWANMIRKITVLDQGTEADERLVSKVTGSVYADGDTVDDFTIKKPEAFEMYISGFDTIQKHISVFRDQLNTAFSSPEEFGRFLTMVMQNFSDQLEQTRESMSRAAICNLIGAVVEAGQEVKLITAYNTLTGKTLTATTVFDPANWTAFTQFCYATIEQYSKMMTERTTLYHVNPFKDGVQKKIARHTPKANQNLYMLTNFRDKMQNMAIANVFNASALDKPAVMEEVNFWNDPQNPGNIKLTMSYMDKGSASADASIKSKAFTNNTVIGLLCDSEAVGLTIGSSWDMNTRINAASGHYNHYHHETIRYVNDLTENAVVFTLA